MSSFDHDAIMTKAFNGKYKLCGKVSAGGLYAFITQGNELIIVEPDTESAGYLRAHEDMVSEQRVNLKCRWER